MVEPENMRMGDVHYLYAKDPVNNLSYKLSSQGAPTHLNIHAARFIVREDGDRQRFRNILDMGRQKNPDWSFEFRKVANGQ